MKRIYSHHKSVIYLFIFAVLLLVFQFVQAGGNTTTSSSDGKSKSTVTRSTRVNASQLGREMTRELEVRTGRDYEYTVSRNADGSYTTTSREVQRDSNGNNRTTTTSNHCTATQPNLVTVDIFFVPEGSQPNSAVLATINRPGQPNQGGFLTTSNSSGASTGQITIPANPYQNVMVANNALEVGFSYEPVAMIRNTTACVAETQTSSSITLSRLLSDWRLLFAIPTAFAGSRSSTPPPVITNDYPNYFRTELPFGSNGSFPIRARIDVGNNTTYEWEHYINAFGPLTNGQTTYLKLPPFSTTETGTHRIEVVTDIRHNVDPGHACYATTTPTSAGWGCVRETSETDNDRSEAFTTRVSSTSLQLAVNVNDVTVRAGGTLSEIPFVTINNGRATINDYQYRVMVGATRYASGTRNTTLAPNARETVRALGSYTAPNSPTTIPLTVCAQVVTGTEFCDLARVIVTTPQCSDRRDNDSDGTEDATDPGCFVDPLDPTTYDPNDDNEGDMATTSPSVTIEFKPVVNPVRYNTGAALEYVINGPAPMSCVVTGGGTNSPITHTPPRTTGQVTTTPVTSTQLYTLRCTANVGGGTLQFERTTTVDVLPQIQET